MFFLLRCAFWVGVVFIGVQTLTSVRPPAPAGTSGGVAAAVDAAATAVSVAPGPNVAVVSDVLRLCSEHGAACEAGFSAIEALGGVLGDGLALFARDEAAPAAVGAAAPPAGEAAAPVAAVPLPATAGTLTAADLSEPWAGSDAAIVAGSQARLRLPPPDPRRSPQPPG